MIRHSVAIVLICAACRSADAQSSGPGPDPASGALQKQYDVVLYARTSTQKGSMVFNVAADGSTAYTIEDGLRLRAELRATAGYWWDGIVAREGVAISREWLDRLSRPAPMRTALALLTGQFRH